MQSLSVTTSVGTNGVGRKRGEVGACAHAVVDSVPPVIWFIRKQIRKHRHGLSLPQFRVLCKVNRQPAVSLSELAEHLGSSLPTASRIVAGLVSKGLLIRTGCLNDRRQLELALSTVGRGELGRVWASTHEEIAGPLGKLSREQRASVMEAMAVLQEIFGSAGIPDALGPAPVAAKASDESEEGTGKRKRLARTA